MRNGFSLRAARWSSCHLWLAAVLMIAHSPCHAAKRATAPAKAPVVAPGELPGDQQSFPALCVDGQGAAWVAVVDRSEGRHRIGVYRIDNGRPAGSPTRLEPKDMTGIGTPAVAGLDRGCLVVFPMERNDRWQIAYALIGSAAAEAPTVKFIECSGNANIAPAVAWSGQQGWILWESNAEGFRAIRASRMTRQGAATSKRISAANVNSYNPAIVARADGTFFAAWDSLREQEADIFGANMSGEAWGVERRLTSDPRIERHPALAAWKNQVWMAWQAQSYPGIRLNLVSEQKIVVARVEQDGLQAPTGWLAALCPTNSMLMRPQILFDPSGRLWLSARRPLGPHGGWAPIVWSYDGTSWSEGNRIFETYGRWQGVPLVSTPGGIVAAVQHDNLVAGWKEQGIRPDWESDVAVVPVAPAGPTGDVRLIPVAPLRMPPTQFSLAERRAQVNATLPRQTVEHQGRSLSLYWGDLHDHTDLSVCDRQRNPPGHDLFANARDIENMDFIALTDHGYNFDVPQWAFNGEQTRQNHDPGRLVTFLGEEWTSSKNKPKDPNKPVGRGNAMRYGHHNLIFLDPYHPSFYDECDGDISPADLWRQLDGKEFICIPHELADWEKQGRGNPPTDWSFHDERLQPVAEIFQTRQSYEYFGCPRQSPEGAPFAGLYYLQDAWAMGLVIGTIASPDHGGGMGKAGVWATDLTRDALFAAIRARHTFGTSGAKMALLLRVGEAMMGDRVPRRAGPIVFRVKAVAACDIKELVIFRNNTIVHRLEPGKKAVEIEWTDTPPNDGKPLWYYARIHATDDELAWTSPIWFSNTGPEAPH